MKIMLLLVLVLLVSSCASTDRGSEPSPRPSLPSAVTNPSPATTEGELTKSSQAGLLELLIDSQQFYDDTLEDLKASLRRARVPLPTTAPAATSR